MSKSRIIVNFEIVNKVFTHFAGAHRNSSVYKWLNTTFKRYLINEYPNVIELEEYKIQIWLEDPSVSNTLRDRYLSGNVKLILIPIITDQEMEEWNHMYDFMSANQQNLPEYFKLPQDYRGIDVKTMIKRSKMWTKWMDKETKRKIKEGLITQDAEKDIKVVKEFENGYKIVELLTQKAFNREHVLMAHCIHTYWRRHNEITVWSLRDGDNMPHATWHLENGEIEQIQGYQDHALAERYCPMVLNFLEEIGMVNKISQWGLDKINRALINGRICDMRMKVAIEQEDVEMIRKLAEDDNIYRQYVKVKAWNIIEKCVNSGVINMEILEVLKEVGLLEAERDSYNTNNIARKICILPKEVVAFFRQSVVINNEIISLGVTAFIDNKDSEGLSEYLEDNPATIKDNSLVTQTIYKNWYEGLVLLHQQGFSIECDGENEPIVAAMQQMRNNDDRMLWYILNNSDVSIYCSKYYENLLIRIASLHSDYHNMTRIILNIADRLKIDIYNDEAWTHSHHEGRVVLPYTFHFAKYGMFDLVEESIRRGFDVHRKINGLSLIDYILMSSNIGQSDEYIKTKTRIINDLMKKGIEVSHLSREDIARLGFDTYKKVYDKKLPKIKAAIINTYKSYDDFERFLDAGVVINIGSSNIMDGLLTKLLNKNKDLDTESYNTIIRLIKKLLKLGFNPNQRAEYQSGITVIMNYITGEVNQQNLRILLKLFLKYGLDLNIRTYCKKRNRCDKPFTMLSYVACWGPIENMKTLIEMGADPNGQDGVGQTPLHRLVRWIRGGMVRGDVNTYIDKIKLLLEKGANVDIKDNDGYTVLDCIPKTGKMAKIRDMMSFYR